MKRSFNIAGPCDLARHYMLPAAQRLPSARSLILKHGYFILHAPRQSGKTTSLRQLAFELNREGDRVALYVSCEAAETAQHDVQMAEAILLHELHECAREQLAPDLQPQFQPRGPTGTRIKAALSDWAKRCPKPIVLLLDEIDALRDESLRSILRQLRAGFTNRPAGFPGSVILCGLRDVRDYKISSGQADRRLGSSSPFNIKLKSISLVNFSEDEIAQLYQQHHDATGQAFTPGAITAAWTLSQGQPWLVNALAHEIIEEMQVPTAWPITAAHLDRAKENLILARQTHLDSLVARLQEPRVRRILEPLMAGQMILSSSYSDDVLYLRDLGLIAKKPPVRVANPIYKEVIVRVLNAVAQEQIVTSPRSYILPDGRLSRTRILTEFTAFWIEHGEILNNGMVYHEVAPQLILMAYLQRVVNGGGYLDREYGVGRGRIDLLLRWPYKDAAGAPQLQREAFELKVWADGRPDPLGAGLKQLDGYLERLQLNDGVLILFDRRSTVDPIERRACSTRHLSPSGRSIEVLRV